MDRVEDLGAGVTPTKSSAKSVAIVGGGYAGLAAAVKLSELGMPSTVFEAAKILGGRARRIDYRGITLDNGQHILSGAYTELLRMMALVDVPDSAYQRIPLTLNMPPDFSLSAPNLPAPFHMAAALLTARGLSWGDRFAAIRLMQALKSAQFKFDANLSVADLLKQYRQPPKLIQYLWQPLTISALNTPLATASAQVFANVLRDALAASRSASDLILPKVDLSELFPVPAVAWLEARGSRVQTGARVTAIEKSDTGFEVIYGGKNENYSSLIMAVAPHQLDTLQSHDAAIQSIFSNATSHFQYEPITTIYVAFPLPAQPIPFAMSGRANGMVQWWFDRDALAGDVSADVAIYAGVISASGPHEQLSPDALIELALHELREWLPHLPEPLWHKVINEKRATFACTPSLNRPDTITSVSGLTLAGDYVACDYPATLEAAIRNGVQAAEMTFANL